MPLLTRKHRRMLGLKKFSGKNFTYDSTFRKKTDAKTKAERLRKKGCKARVIPEEYGWSIYRRGCKPSNRR